MKTITPSVSGSVLRKVQIKRRGVDRRAGAEIVRRLEKLEQDSGDILRAVLETSAALKRSNRMLASAKAELVERFWMDDAPVKLDHELLDSLELAIALHDASKALARCEEIVAHYTGVPIATLRFLHKHSRRALERALGGGLLAARPSDDLLALAVLAVSLQVLPDPKFVTKHWE
jgi:hypothetical protein